MAPFLPQPDILTLRPTGNALSIVRPDILTLRGKQSKDEDGTMEFHSGLQD